MFLCILIVTLACGSDSREIRIAATVTVVDGHDHFVSITYRLLQSGIRTFSLEERAGHSHTVTLTENQAALLNLGLPVVAESSLSAGHMHSVTLQLQE
ncbi:MAG: hypothetical protein K8S54_08970 [Spirochaetia bacterium]|nr:hypothetical protein [Spirochaetia bacterium]